MSELAIDARGVTKVYGEGAVAYHALRGVDFSARRGEFVMLSGPSGSGKTTLLSILGCVLRATAGTVRLYDTDITAVKERALPALRGIHWRVTAGQQWACLGPNGAGKTSLAKIISRQATHFSGTLVRSPELEQQGAELRARMAELHDRKIIDRAKGLLMQRQNLTEQAAYDKLRKTAMDKNLRLADVAQRMLDVADLLG